MSDGVCRTRRRWKWPLHHGVIVDLGDKGTVNTDGGFKGIGEKGRCLTGHGVNDEDGLIRFDFLELKNVIK